MFLKVLSFVMRHKLVCAVGIVSIPAGVALLAYQRRREGNRQDQLTAPTSPRVRPVGEDAPAAAPLTREEIEKAQALETAWRH